jgi:hypothetical protein
MLTQNMVRGRLTLLAEACVDGLHMAICAWDKVSWLFHTGSRPGALLLFALRHKIRQNEKISRV